MPAAERTNLQVLRTDTATFTDLVESRRNRRDDWYKVPAGKIDLCNVPIPIARAACRGREKMNVNAALRIHPRVRLHGLG